MSVEGTAVSVGGTAVEVLVGPVSGGGVSVVDKRSHPVNSPMMKKRKAARRARLTPIVSIMLPHILDQFARSPRGLMTGPVVTVAA